MKKSRPPREHRILVEMLRELRERASLTQIELAKLLKVGQSVISKWESGDRRIDMIQLRRWCRMTDASLVEFVEEFEKRLAAK